MTCNDWIDHQFDKGVASYVENYFDSNVRSPPPGATWAQAVDTDCTAVVTGQDANGPLVQLVAPPNKTVSR